MKRTNLINRCELQNVRERKSFITTRIYCVYTNIRHQQICSCRKILMQNILKFVCHYKVQVTHTHAHAHAHTHTHTHTHKIYIYHFSENGLGKKLLSYIQGSSYSFFSKGGNIQDGMDREQDFKKIHIRNIENMGLSFILYVNIACATDQCILPGESAVYMN